MRFINIFIFSLLLPGCAYIHSLDENLPGQIDIWIKNKDYGKALDTLYYIQKDHKNYNQLMRQKETVVKLAGLFEQDILEKGAQYLIKRDWHHADETYEYGLDKLPNNRKLKKAHNEFIHKRTVYLKQLKLRILQNKTQWLINDSKIRNEISRVIPKNYSARWLLQDHNLDIDSTSKTLIECVSDSIKNHELEVAKQCLKIANQLTPSPYFQNKFIEASKQLEQAIQLRSRKLSKSGKKTLRTAQMALAKGDFNMAHQNINLLPVEDQKNGQVLKFKNILEEQTEDYVDKTITEGRRLYSKGKVQEAYLLWKSLKPISPDNERLQNLIDRAEKILRKLHKIGNKQDIIVLPAKQN
ncbi:MAG: hypothetical protein OEY52_04755 [Gammaproteobacteria bacterium]|nr:hypothetical protein [Gammaproteobacteria bacterium]